MNKVRIALFTVFAAVITFVISSASSYANQTREAVVKRGNVNCGVSQGVPGFSNADASGNWSGIDVDLCRAVAAAVSVSYTHLTLPTNREV